MSVNIVIPVKDYRQGKTRLSPALNARERACFALHLYRKTLAFFSEHFPGQPLSVVTPSPAMATIARSAGATVIREPRAAGLSCAARRAARFSLEQGFDTQLLIPADIAELSVREINTLLATALRGPSVTVCPAVDGGTNALMTSPPDAIDFSFGPHSGWRHVIAARRRGLHSQLLRLRQLSHDIDTPADLPFQPAVLSARSA